MSAKETNKEKLKKMTKERDRWKYLAGATHRENEGLREEAEAVGRAAEVLSGTIEKELAITKAMFLRTGETEIILTDAEIKEAGSTAVYAARSDGGIRLSKGPIVEMEK